MKLDGKVALITVAGTGIGAAIAERFVEDGARLCITGRRKECSTRWPVRCQREGW
jgi:NAD(P)-dependent dehydrogenase (short-subunit alcohol dehydrogenase family)